MKRKGSIAIYIEPWHSDIYDFLDLRKNRGKEELRARDLFTALWIPDLFMKRIKEDGMWTLMCPNECKGLSDVYDDYEDKAFTKLYEKYESEGKGRKQVKARELWAKVLESQIETGTPYVLYKDAANRKSNQKNIGVVKSSNLCIAGDQRVVTDMGYITAEELNKLDIELNLFNNEEVVRASKMIKRGIQEDVYKITLENGMSHKVTSYHGIPVINSKGDVKRVECKDLKIGDKVAVQTNKGLFGKANMVDEAYLLGLYQSDGTQNDSSIMFDVWENDFDILTDVEKAVERLYSKYSHVGIYSNKGGKFIDCSVGIYSNVRKKRLTTTLHKTLEKNDISFKKGFVPSWMWRSDEETQWAYIKGLLQADGAVFKSKAKGNPIQISYSDINYDFLSELQLIFNNLGLSSSIRLLGKGGRRLLPNGKGGKSYYDVKTCYRLIVSNKNSARVINNKTGFLDRKGVILDEREYRDNTKKGYKVKLIEYVGKEDVYCPTVYNDEHIFVSNGMLTFNCTEIIEVSTPEETAVCNLISLPVNKFIDIPKSKDKSKRVFNHQSLFDATYQGTLNLNKIIDVNYYPTDKAKKSNMKNRPIGIGVQGLADAFAIMGYAFDSEEAKKLNKEIFETIYFASLTASADLAKRDGAYETFDGSPFSKGILQFDMWENFDKEKDLSGRWDWDGLKKRIISDGVRNSLLLAPMPTASSAQILGNNECFEPFTANIYKRNTLSGEYIIINKHLIDDLVSLNLWNDKTRIDIIKANGSIQEIEYIPSNIKDRYKTVWELSQKVIIEMAADRGLFIDQSQSMNLFIPNVNSAKLNSALFYGWEKGLKTGMYYMRTMVKSSAMKSLGVSETNEVVEKQSTEIPNIVNEKNDVVMSTDISDIESGLACSLDDDECLACGA